MSQPEMKVLKDGCREWRVNGRLHREDGPAREWPDGFREWRVNGVLHREDGPAVEWPSAGRRAWRLNGKKVTWFEVFEAAVRTGNQEAARRILANPK